MCEQKKTLYFEASYTLDMISFLDLLFSDNVSKEDEIVTHFEGMLSDQSPILMQKARKGMPENQTFTSMLIPLLTADHEFNDLRLSELLGSPKYLIATFKKHPDFKKVPKIYKKFIKRQAESVITHLALIIRELEKAKFKSFWLENRLPLINQKIRCYEKEIFPLRLVETLNTYVNPLAIERRNLYISSFYEGDSVTLFNQDLMASIQATSSQLIQGIIDQLNSSLTVEKRLKPYIKAWKSNVDVMEAFKAVKGEYSTVSAYVEQNIKLALMAVLYQKFNVIDQPYQYLGRYNFGTHKMSVLFYHYMETNPKQSKELLQDYLLKVVEESELELFETQYVTIMNQQL